MLPNFRRMILVAALAVVIFGWMAQSAAWAQLSGAIFTTDTTGNPVNLNIYANKTDVYLNGGPAGGGPALPNGTYYFQVTDPSGATLLSTDNAVCRQLVVSGGVVSGVPGSPPAGCTTGLHAVGTDPNVVQLFPFSDTPNPDGVYKAWLIAQSSAVPGCNPTIDQNDAKKLIFTNNCSKTDNFRVPPPGLVRMPISKWVNERNVSDEAACINGTPSPVDPNDPDGPQQRITTCTDPVIGTLTVVCTSQNGNFDDLDDLVNNVFNGFCTPTPNGVQYLPQFTTALYSDVIGGTTETPPGSGFFPDNQPDNFPDADCTDGPPGCLGSALIPPIADPFFPAGVPFVGCEVNIPAGWYLPDGGVTVDPTLSPNDIGPSNPTVYTPAASTTDRNRCFNTVIPQGSTLFEIELHNTPVGGILVSKNSIGGTGVFTFGTTGGGDCQKAETNTPPPHTPGIPNFADICTGFPTSADPGSFTLDTGDGNPIQTTTSSGVLQPAYTVDARTNFGGLLSAVAVGDSPGSGYTVGTVVAVTGGGGTGATVKITSVNSGAVDGVVLLTSGSGYTTTPSATTSLISGAGSGLTLDITATTILPYSVVETDAPDGLASWKTSVNCVGDNGTVDTGDDHSEANTAFGVRPAEIVTCAFTNRRKRHRMTGGGSVFTTSTGSGQPPVGTRVTHGFQLNCDSSLKPNNLQVNWGSGRGSNRFHLESLTSAACTLNGDPFPPAADFNTYVGTGTGRFNGATGYTAEWTFVDNGEPGKSDTLKIKIYKNGNVVLWIQNPVNLNVGNHQAHSDQ